MIWALGVVDDIPSNSFSIECAREGVIFQDNGHTVKQNNAILQ